MRPRQRTGGRTQHRLGIGGGTQEVIAQEVDRLDDMQKDYAFRKAQGDETIYRRSTADKTAYKTFAAGGEGDTRDKANYEQWKQSPSTYYSSPNADDINVPHAYSTVEGGKSVPRKDIEPARILRNDPEYVADWNNQFSYTVMKDKVTHAAEMLTLNDITGGTAILRQTGDVVDLSEMDHYIFRKTNPSFLMADRQRNGAKLTEEYYLDEEGNKKLITYHEYEVMVKTSDFDKQMITDTEPVKVEKKIKFNPNDWVEVDPSDSFTKYRRKDDDNVVISWSDYNRSRDSYNESEDKNNVEVEVGVINQAKLIRQSFGEFSNQKRIDLAVDRIVDDDGTERSGWDTFWGDASDYYIIRMLVPDHVSASLPTTKTGSGFVQQAFSGAAAVANEKNQQQNLRDQYLQSGEITE